MLWRIQGLQRLSWQRIIPGRRGWRHFLRRPSAGPGSWARGAPPGSGGSVERRRPDCFRQRMNRAELAGGVQEIMEADASIQEIRMMDSTHFYVYLDSDVWERSTQQERAAYCETLSERLEAQCRVNGFLGSRETLRVYYYNGDGRLLAWPADH